MKGPRRPRRGRQGGRAACGALLLVLLVILAASRPARGHFLLSVTLRTIHVEALDGGFRVFIRLPLPMVVATPEHLRNPDDPSVVAPYTVNRVVDSRLWHSLDLARVRADSEGLGRLVAEGHALVVEGRRLLGRVEAVRVHDARGIHSPVPPFGTLEAAKSALGGPVRPLGSAEVPAGDALVDIAVFYPHAGAKSSFLFSSSLGAGLPGAERTENMLRFYRGDGTVSVYRARGLLTTPIAGGASPLAFAATFTSQGVRHILEGADHLLFLLCLVLGAATLRGLVAQATGFTVGHSVTLIAGFLGSAPRVPWFVPAVETGIALSIIYVAAVALLSRVRSTTLAATTLVGLLHGFGFSFFLSEILELDSSHLGLGLVSFNAGVEIGQLVVIALVWPALRLLDRRTAHLSGYVRALAAAGSMAVALLWVVTRSAALLQSL